MPPVLLTERIARLSYGRRTAALRYFDRAYVSLASSTRGGRSHTSYTCALPRKRRSAIKMRSAARGLALDQPSDRAEAARRKMYHGLTLPLSKTDRFETAQRFSQSCHRQLTRSRANREHHGTLAFQYRNKLWANLLQCLSVGVDFAGKASPSDASAIPLELALDDKAGRAVG